MGNRKRKEEDLERIDSSSKSWMTTTRRTQTGAKPQLKNFQKNWNWRLAKSTSGTGIWGKKMDSFKTAVMLILSLLNTHIANSYE